jgi:hypothetical protein
MITAKSSQHAGVSEQKKGDPSLMNHPSHKASKHYLEISIIAFFVLAAFSLLLVYVVDPSIYAQSLSLTSSPADRYPLPVTLFLVGVLAFISLLIFGVCRHWRWLFWLLLIAFGSSFLQFAAMLLQLLGVLSTTDPLWYRLLRMAVVVVELGLAIWMVRIYRNAGVWAMGKNVGENFKLL